MLPVIELVQFGLEKIFPDPKERSEAKAKLIEAEQRGELKELDQRYSAIQAEAKSGDKWTSRARPGFLYVMYFYLVSAPLAGVLFVWFPEEVGRVIEGFQLFLNGIPGEMWALFGAGYLGYVKKRSDDKARNLGMDIKEGLISKILG